MISAPDVNEEPNVDPPTDIEADLFISVFGEKKEEVSESLAGHLGEEDTHLYQTWVNVSAMRRLGFLFEGGVESAGGVFDILCVLTIAAAVVAVFAFWQVLVYIAVIVVLTIFSGGAAFKFLRGSYIEAVSEKIPSEKLESFVVDQLAGGSFIHVRAPDGYELKYASKQSSTSTKVFRSGIYFALFIATIFMIFEVAYYFLAGVGWMTDLVVLALFGSGFLIGIAVMDLGVLLRRQLAGRVRY
ncbi:MAG: hypothetical protein KAR33_05785 [Candidatus Thorarchaeota archaeon]|nr:hypothetical protein [Candidatus Thorarchaeota archaeon]